MVFDGILDDSIRLWKSALLSRNSGIASYVIMFGTQNTITVYTAKNIPIHTTLYLFTFFTYIPTAIVLFLLFNRIDILILTLAYAIGNLTMGEILGHRNYGSYFTYMLVQKLLTFVLGILFFNQFGSNGLIFALSITHIHFIYRIVKEFRNIKIDFSLLKKRWGFIINNYTIYLTYSLQGQIDKLIIMPLLGASILGNYSLALQVITALTILPSVIIKYLLPQESHGKNPLAAKRILIIISILITLIGVLIVPEIILKTYPTFIEAIEAIKIMSLSLLPNSMTRIYTAKFLANEKSKFVLIAHMISVAIMITSMIILGSNIGLSGVAMAYVIASTIPAILLFIINRKYHATFV